MSLVTSHLAAVLSDELRSRQIVDLGTSICEEIVLAMFKQTAEYANTRIMTEAEAAEISKRST